MPHANEAAYRGVSSQVKTRIPAIDFPAMLVDVALLLAPLLAAFPAAAGVLTSDARVASKRRLEKHLYTTLLVVEKLPPSAAGVAGIARDVDRQTLGVAYAAQYPRRTRELRQLALLVIAVVATIVGYYVLWWRDASLLTLLIALGVVAALALWFERALLNFSRNDGVAFDLFAHFGGSPELHRPRTELAAKVPALSLDDVFARAADVRDANTGVPMTTLESVNAALAQVHAVFDWRRAAMQLSGRARHADYRWHATLAWERTRHGAAIAYDWTLRHLLGPFFAMRLAFLEHRERHRVGRAHRAGDVFAAAWLPVHYRNERDRLAKHWGRLSATVRP